MRFPELATARCALCMSRPRTALVPNACAITLMTLAVERMHLEVCAESATPPARIGNASGADPPRSVREWQIACVAGPNVHVLAPLRDAIEGESALSHSRAPPVLHCLQPIVTAARHGPARARAKAKAVRRVSAGNLAPAAHFFFSFSLAVAFSCFFTCTHGIFSLLACRTCLGHDCRKGTRFSNSRLALLSVFAHLYNIFSPFSDDLAQSTRGRRHPCACLPHASRPLSLNAVAVIPLRACRMRLVSSLSTRSPSSLCAPAACVSSPLSLSLSTRSPFLCAPAACVSTAHCLEKKYLSLTRH